MPSRKFTLDLSSGVPVYRQIIDQVMAGIAAKSFVTGDQLPTVRQLAVELQINPNTVTRAYKELEIRGLLDTHHGTGTFIGNTKVERSELEHQKRLNQFIGDFVARAGAAGFTVEELLGQLQEIQAESKKKRK